jgi:hypothetical protein
MPLVFDKSRHDLKYLLLIFVASVFIFIVVALAMTAVCHVNPAPSFFIFY